MPRALRFLTAVLGASLLASCDALNPFRCTIEYRFGEFEGPLVVAGAAPGPAVGAVLVVLDEFRGETRQQMIGWRVETTAPFPDSVTAIHVHDPRTPDVVLTSILPRRVGPFLALSSNTPHVSYEGTIPYATFFRRLEEGRLYLDVHTPATGLSTPALRATLTRTGGRDWHGSCAY
ncbi:MAG TPA: hypothetical protein VD948_01475 [Rhodothermales bacterium]|nr:hypothetical protein [Rhodothermales bacterium]